MENFYLCDPTLNTICNKSGCYINGGPCRLTYNPDKAYKLDNAPILIISKEDFDEREAMDVNSYNDFIDMKIALAILRFNEKSNVKYEESQNEKNTY